MSRLKFIRQGLVLSGNSGWCNHFFESLDYENEHFEGFCGAILVSKLDKISTRAEILYRGTNSTVQNFSRGRNFIQGYKFYGTKFQQG